MKNVLACSTHTYSKYSLERALAGIAGCGLKYVELAAIAGHTDHVVPDGMTDSDYAALNTLLKDHGLTAVSVSGHVDPTQPENIQKMKDRVVLANRVGAKFLNTLSGHPHTEDETQRLFAQMRKLGDFARDHDVTICFETHGGIMGKSADCRKTVEAINHPNVRINYDPANIIYFIGDRPEEDIHGVIGLISHFHIKDKLGGPGEWNFPAIGSGTIDFPTVIGPLLASGYDGPFSFELEFTPEGLESSEAVDEALRESVEYVESLGVVSR